MGRAINTVASPMGSNTFQTATNAYVRGAINTAISSTTVAAAGTGIAEVGTRVFNDNKGLSWTQRLSTFATIFGANTARALVGAFANKVADNSLKGTIGKGYAAVTTPLNYGVQLGTVGGSWGVIVNQWKQGMNGDSFSSNFSKDFAAFTDAFSTPFIIGTGLGAYSSVRNLFPGAGNLLSQAFSPAKGYSYATWPLAAGAGRFSYGLTQGQGFRDNFEASVDWMKLALGARFLAGGAGLTPKELAGAKWNVKLANYFTTQDIKGLTLANIGRYAALFGTGATANVATEFAKGYIEKGLGYSGKDIHGITFSDNDMKNKIGAAVFRGGFWAVMAGLGVSSAKGIFNQIDTKFGSLAPKAIEGTGVRGIDGLVLTGAEKFAWSGAIGGLKWIAVGTQFPIYTGMYKSIAHLFENGRLPHGTMLNYEVANMRGFADEEMEKGLVDVKGLAPILDSNRSFTKGFKETIRTAAINSPLDGVYLNPLIAGATVTKTISREPINWAEKTAVKLAKKMEYINATSLNRVLMGEPLGLVKVAGVVTGVDTLVEVSSTARVIPPSKGTSASNIDYTQAQLWVKDGIVTGAPLGYDLGKEGYTKLNGESADVTIREQISTGMNKTERGTAGWSALILAVRPSQYRPQGETGDMLTLAGGGRVKVEQPAAEGKPALGRFVDESGAVIDGKPRVSITPIEGDKVAVKSYYEAGDTIELDGGGKAVITEANKGIARFAEIKGQDYVVGPDAKEFTPYDQIKTFAPKVETSKPLSSEPGLGTGEGPGAPGAEVRKILGDGEMYSEPGYEIKDPLAKKIAEELGKNKQPAGTPEARPERPATPEELNRLAGLSANGPERIEKVNDRLSFFEESHNLARGNDYNEGKGKLQIGAAEILTRPYGPTDQGILTAIDNGKGKTFVVTDAQLYLVTREGYKGIILTANSALNPAYVSEDRSIGFAVSNREFVKQRGVQEGRKLDIVNMDTEIDRLHDLEKSGNIGGARAQAKEIARGLLDRDTLDVISIKAFGFLHLTAEGYLKDVPELMDALKSLRNESQKVSLIADEVDTIGMENIQFTQSAGHTTLKVAGKEYQYPAQQVQEIFTKARAMLEKGEITKTDLLEQQRGGQKESFEELASKGMKVFYRDGMEGTGNITSGRLLLSKAIFEAFKGHEAGLVQSVFEGMLDTFGARDFLTLYVDKEDGKPRLVSAVDQGIADPELVQSNFVKVVAATLEYNARHGTNLDVGDIRITTQTSRRAFSLQQFTGKRVAGITATPASSIPALEAKLGLRYVEQGGLYKDAGSLPEHAEFRIVENTDVQTTKGVIQESLDKGQRVILLYPETDSVIRMERALTEAGLGKLVQVFDSKDVESIRKGEDASKKIILAGPEAGRGVNFEDNPTIVIIGGERVSSEEMRHWA
ncbi:MAG: hypothetical protein WCL25_04120, partial [bacterium]